MESDATYEIWADDHLGREQDAIFLQDFLLGRIRERGESGLSKSYVLNIDAGWGHGKTFFLERLRRTLESNGYIVASINAWADDHADDPLLAVIDGIDKVVAPLINTRTAVKNSWKAIKKTGATVVIAAAKGAATQLARKVIGDGLDEILHEVGQLPNKGIADAVSKATDKRLDEAADAILNRFTEGKNSINKFRTDLSHFLENVSGVKYKTPLFVLVDELDRCRPTYAIGLLERVKHLFSIDNIVFIFATDAEQLQHAIGAVYGAGFDSKRYLFRFFDRTYVFEKPSLEQFVAALVEASPIDLTKISLPDRTSLAAFLGSGFSEFGLSLRDAEQCYEILRNIVTVWSAPLPLEFIVLFPLAVAHQQRIALGFGASFQEQVKDLIAKNNGTRNAWKFTFQKYEERRTMNEEVNGMSLFSAMVSESASALPNMKTRDSPNERELWVQSRFRAEFMTLHKNQFNPANPPYSVIRKYPELVRSAGRLVPF